MKISVIMPALDEGENLSGVIDEIISTLENTPWDFEIIVVDDGSTDSTWEVISNKSSENQKIKGVRLIKNYGQATAIYAGIQTAEGDVIVIMDADGQNDPKDIPRLISQINKGFDIVSGCRVNRKDGFIRRIFSGCGNYLVRKISGVKLRDIGCSLKAYKRELLTEIVLIGEMHRILPVYLAERGANIVEIEVNHRKRRAGKSKYSLNRVIKLIMDLILYKFFTGFISRPIYIFGGIGFFSILFSIIIALFVVIRKLFWHGQWLSPLFFISVTLLTVGILFIMLGIVAELVVRIYYKTNQPPFVIKETINI